MTDEEQVGAFIREHGVTKCPGYGDPALKGLHIKRMRDYEAAGMAGKLQMQRAGVIPGETAWRDFR